jgi:hypothetical protein
MQDGRRFPEEDANYIKSNREKRGPLGDIGPRLIRHLEDKKKGLKSL